MELQEPVNEMMPVRLVETHLLEPGKRWSDLRVSVLDRPGSGSANHRYVISNYDAKTNPSLDEDGVDTEHPTVTVILFQNGPIAEVGRNGLTHEVLLAIIADRLASFQSGPYACEANDHALMHVKRAMVALQNRTLARMERGVEGTHQI